MEGAQTFYLELCKQQAEQIKQLLERVGEEEGEKALKEENIRLQAALDRANYMSEVQRQRLNSANLKMQDMQATLDSTQSRNKGLDATIRRLLAEKEAAEDKMFQVKREWLLEKKE